MRTALRSSIVTAALAGALLAPAATALAAPASQPAGATAAAGPASSNSRYAGEPVYIGEGLVAVLRNKAEGPEAWIRAVGPNWKPGDDYMVRVVAVVDRAHPALTANGLQLKLTKADTAAPVLVVTTNGKATSHPLPKGTAGPVCGTVTKQVNLGAGLLADMSMSTAGPEVTLRTGTDSWRHLDRTFPALPASDGIVARIVNPSGAAPVFEWRTQGGDTPFGHASFPALPKGCKPDYKVVEDRGADKLAPKPTPSVTAPAAKPATPVAEVGVAPAADIKPQTGAQTVVVPQGGVAAGAVFAADDTGDTTTAVATGAGLAAVLAAVGAAFLMRRRTQR
ncbi:LPXTG cell wall anchor domain-containing protein [Streptomyces sp. NPDC002287]